MEEELCKIILQIGVGLFNRFRSAFLTLYHTFVFQVNADVKLLLEDDNSELDKIMTKFSDELSARVFSEIFHLLYL